jgi:hypothetical protein
MAAADSQDLPLNIPDPDALRARLAAVLTEADLLRAQLRVSTRLQRERERLRRLRAAAAPRKRPRTGKRVAQ